MKYLVTGATGFIGLELCRQIRQDGHELIAFSLRGEAMPDGTPTRAVDFSKENLSAAELNSVDTVFHLAAIAHQQAAIADYDAVNHCAVLELARQAHMARVKNFVFHDAFVAQWLERLPCKPFVSLRFSLRQKA